MSSSAEKEGKKQAELQLAGSDSEDARAAVKAQRELKKKRDTFRKLEKKLKGIQNDADKKVEYDAVKAAVDEAAAEVYAIEEKLAELTRKAVESANAPDLTSAASSSPPPPSLSTVAATEEEVEKNSQMRFVGQSNDEARSSVKVQRDLKKKHDALRKVQKKIRAGGKDAEVAAAMEQKAALLTEIGQLKALREASWAPSTAHISATPCTSAAATASPSPTALATVSINKSSSAEVTRSSEPVKEITAEERAASAKRLHDLVQGAMDANSLKCLHVLPRDAVVHPRIAEVAVLMEQMLLVGGSARALALISAFRELTRTTTVLAVPSLNEVDTTAFEKLIQINFDFVRRKREASAGMRHVKDVLVRRFVALRDEVIHPKPNMVDLIKDLGGPREVTLKILDVIEAELKMSFKSIVEDRSLPYVSSSDTILVFGRSSLVEYILLSRSRDPQCKPKRVIVIDSAPLFEGRQLAEKLSSASIDVTYGLITACCTLMPKCTRVFMGASAVLQNGDMFGRCGMALVAACAKLFRKPVLCFSESYKFVPEVWVGNLAQNTKLADMRPAAEAYGSDTGTHSPLGYPTPRTLSPPQLRVSGGWGLPARGADFLARNNGAGTTPFSSSASGYLYDLTPASYVDMIICEMGCLHTSAIVAAIKDREGRDTSQLVNLIRG
ncbi:translation initiation factor eIF2B subunit-like protein, putative [Leishmania tarentolae]|uniref:Translation initiation factor eIF2B subunit delta n=1 Tax=Leishmania tarentolae TaxID=5689 RepID=A0A640KJ95_LEITA|nr:translation initiation factor eIF2B subunit-like protein, putative [Leishmania tarentolae]